MTVTSDGKTVMTLPVSLGKAATPTFSGVKIVMEKDRVERMIGTDPADPYDLQVPWSVRLTNSGEFVHAASWNGGNIGIRSTSNGCTNLTVTDAEKYFNFAQIGDVFNYTNTGGGAMPVWDGYGDWNVAWSTWQTGGAI
jgi:lipoprotein-anchoring transpeptidase ErfK/SrfK